MLASLAVVCSMFVPPAARAGQWRITPAVGASAIFTDNANSVTDDQDRNADYLASVSPGVTVSGSGGRLSLDLGFTHEQFRSFLGASDESQTNTLLANGQAELYDRVAFLSVNSSITRQVVNAAEPVASVDTGSSSSNRTTVRTLSLQPYFLHHFGTFLETESRYRFDVSQTASDEVSDTRSSGESFQWNSGRYFSVFSFSGRLSQDKTSRTDGQPRTLTTEATTNYRLRTSRFLSLLSSVGWRNIDDETIDQNTRGFTWSAGFAAQPNSRSSMEFTYGEEFDTTNITLDAQYTLSSRTSVSASYTEEYTTSEQLLSDDLSFLVDDGTGTLIDSRTGQPFDPANPNFGFRTTVFRRQVLTVGMNATRRRNSYDGTLTWERRDDEATDILQRVYEIGLGFSRRINPRLSGRLSGNATRTDFGTTDDRVDTQYGLSASLTYQLMKNTTASLIYTGSRITSTLGENNFHDNVLTITLNHQF